MNTVVIWFLGVLGGLVSVVVGWAWTIDRRVGRLEAMFENSAAKLDRLEDKLDRLLDKLL